MKHIRYLLGLVVLVVAAASTARAQTPQNCTAAEVYWNTTQSSFYYHCPNGNAWVRVPFTTAGGGGLVTSVFTRTGDVVAQPGDYNASQVTNAFNLATPNNLGANYFDITQIAQPVAPAGGNARVYFDSATGLLACINSSLASCMPAGGGGGAVSSVFGRTGAVTALSGDYNFNQLTGTVNLATQVSGNLPVANLGGGIGANSTTFWRGDGTWAPGGVSSVSIGNLTPLFNATVSTPTSTPAISFALLQAGPHQFFGNATGSTATPTYVQPSFTDIAGTCQISQGCTGQTTANNALNALLPTQTGNNGRFLQTNGASTSWQPALSNPMTTLGDIIYGAGGGAPTRLAGPTSVNGVASMLCDIPASNLATAPQWCTPGVTLNAQVGTTYTIQPSDLISLVTTSNSGAIAGTIPQAGTTGFQTGFAFVNKDLAAGCVTWTPVPTSTIDGLTSRVVCKDEGFFVYSNGLNYTSIHTVSPYSVSTFTNKTYDTAGSGNLFRINGTTINAITGTLGTLASAGFTAPASPKCAEIDTNGNLQIAGTNAACGAGGSSSGNAGPNYAQSFTLQTTITMAGTSHNLNTKNLLLSCYDTASPANGILPASWTVNSSSFDVVVNFGVSQSGYCVLNGSGPPKYATTFTGQTSVTINGSTHNLGTADLQVTVWDSATGTRNRIEPASVAIDSTTFNVTVNFAVSQSGRIVIQ